MKRRKRGWACISGTIFINYCIPFVHPKFWFINTSRSFKTLASLLILKYRLIWRIALILLGDLWKQCISINCIVLHRAILTQWSLVWFLLRDLRSIIKTCIMVGTSFFKNFYISLIGIQKLLIRYSSCEIFLGEVINQALEGNHNYR